MWRAGRQTGDGKAGVLFKKFAGIDVFDEVDELDPDKLLKSCRRARTSLAASTSKTLAPECFYDERNCAKADEYSGIPTISTARQLSALRHPQLGLRVGRKNIFRRNADGGFRRGAQQSPCMNLLVALGLQKTLSWFCDSKALSIRVKPGQTWRNKSYCTVDDSQQCLDDVIEGAEYFLAGWPESA